MYICHCIPPHDIYKNKGTYTYYIVFVSLSASFLTAGQMVMSSSSRSRSTKRSPERRKSPPAAPESAVAAPEPERKETDAAAEKKESKQRPMEKRAKGSVGLSPTEERKEILGCGRSPSARG